VGGQGVASCGGDGCGNCYVLLPSGQVGFVDTISGRAAVEPDPHPDLYSCVEALLRGDQGLSPSRQTSQVFRCQAALVMWWLQAVCSS
jgi:hypothetical protein